VVPGVVVVVTGAVVVAVVVVVLALVEVPVPFGSELRRWPSRITTT
jgi:hypothetical protein